MSSSRRVLVIEPTTSGHRLYYVRLIVDEILARGEEAMIGTSTGASETDEWKLHLGDISAHVQVLEGVDVSTDGIAKLAFNARVDHVVVPSGDEVAVELGLRRKWTGLATLTLLIMRERPQPSKVFPLARLKGWCKTILLGTANHLNGVRVCLLKSSLWSGHSKFVVAKDPVTLARDVTELKELGAFWGLDPQRYWFGIMGAVSERKNLPLVVAALAGLEGRRIGLVVGGQIAQDVRNKLPGLAQQLSECGVALVVHDRLLEDAELDSLICAVDCVVLAHSNEGSSGVMGKASAVGTRIAAAGAQSLRLDCQAAPQIAAWAPLTRGNLRQLLADSSRLEPPKPVLSSSKQDFASVLL